MKVNSDGSFKGPGFRGSYGIIIRYGEGRMLTGSSGDCYANSSICAEAAGLKAGVSLAMGLNCDSVGFEFDSLELYGALQDDTKIPWHIESIIMELIAMKNLFPS